MSTEPLPPPPHPTGLHPAEWALWIALSLALWAGVWFVAGLLVCLLTPHLA